MKETEKQNPAEILAAISGAQVHPQFGEPFRSAFAAAYESGSDEEITVAAYTCSLFLSAILEGFPTVKLHTFANHTREHCSRFTFDCSRYGPILEKMDKDSLKQVILFDSNGRSVSRECSSDEIKEAFDFYTNR